MFDKGVNKSVQLKGCHVGRGWLYAEPSRAIDRFSNNVQELYLPKTETVPGVMQIKIDTDFVRLSAPYKSLKKILKSILRLEFDAELEIEKGKVAVDFRLLESESCNSALINYMPIALLIREMSSEVGSDLVVIFPRNISEKIKLLFELSGFSVIETNGVVKGCICDFSVEPWVSLRGDRSDIITRCLVNSELINLLSKKKNENDKVFISKRGEGALENESEITDFLAKKGFVHLYAEEVTLAEHYSALLYSKVVVAVHGEGLDPLILKRLVGRKEFTLVEIFSPAFVNNVFRIIASQNGGNWIGVRGNMWPSLISSESDYTNNNKNFTLSVKSLSAALDKIGV